MNGIFDFMDRIVEAVVEFVNSAAEQAAEIADILIKIIIALTAPVWIIPYMLIRTMWRERRGRK